MTKCKKLLSVVMAVLMLSVTVFSASAYTYAPETATSGEIVITTTAEKTTVKPGETVTFYVNIDPGSKTNLAGSGCLIAFNRDQLTPVGSSISEFRSYLGEHAATYANPLANTGNLDMPNGALIRFLTAEEQAYLTRFIMVGNQSTSSANRWNPVPGEALMSFQMTVSESVQPGDEIWIGLHECGFEGGQSYFTYYGDGTRVVRPKLAEYNLTNSMVKLTVASDEPAGPVVAKSKAEVKMTPNSPTTVEDAFQFRVTSVITDADWDTYFANTAAGGNNAITKLGFVAYKGTDGFDLETAKSVAKGGTVAGYDVATTTYVQKADDSSDAYFGAIIQITSAETRSDATYIAYVEYTDAEGATQYAFYDAAQTALLDTNYQTIVESYLAAYPFAG